MNFLLMARRDAKAMRTYGLPEKITIARGRANAAAIEGYNAAYAASIEVRQIKYLNNLVEQDHRAITRVTRPPLGFTLFWAAQRTLAGIELVHMIEKGQMDAGGPPGQTPAEQLYTLAA
jgi:putative transposase